MSTPEIDLTRYQNWCDREDARVAAIEEEAHRLMEAGEECDPHDPENVAEALRNMSDSQKREMSDLLNTVNFSYEELGRLVYWASFDYWDRKSENRATDIIEGLTA